MKNPLKSFFQELKNSFIPGFIIGLCITTGYSLHTYSHTVFAPLFFLLATAIAIIFTATFYYANHNLCVLFPHEKTLLIFVKSPKEYFIVMTALIFMAWIPSYLAVFPGLFVYDIQAQYAQVALHNYNEFQPIFHTLLSGGLVWFGQLLSGSVNYGVSLSCIVQLLIFSITIGYWFYVMYIYQTPLAVRLITLFITLFYPPIVINMMALNKDNFFALFTITFIITNYRMFKEDNFFKSRKNIFLWILCSEGMLTFRNNAIYAFIAFTPIWLFLVVKQSNIKKQAIAMLSATFVIFLILKYPVTQMITSNGIEYQEKMSIPCQQLARVYCNCQDNLTSEERTFIEESFTNTAAIESYCPYMADVTKYYLNVEKISADKKAFWSEYCNLMKKYPKEFLDAFLYTNYGMWYMYPTLTLVWDGTPGYAFLENRYPATTETKLPILYNFFKLFENSKLVQGGAWYSFLFMPALFFYLCIMMLFWGISTRNNEIICSNLFALIICATFLLGPTTLVRYYLYLIFLVPVNLMFVADAQRNLNN